MSIDEETKLRDWYAHNPAEYSKLWEPSLADGIKVDIVVPQTIALPLRKGAIMPHKHLQVLEDHLAGPNTTLGNGNNWGLVQKWLMLPPRRMGAPLLANPGLHSTQAPFCQMKS